MSVPAGYVELERTVDSITVGARHRRDLGDLSVLVASIRDRGLLQPVTITPDGHLVCGARRLAAIRELGWRTVSVWVRSGISDRLAKLLAEQDDNELHKPLNQLEAASLYREVKALLAEDAARRQEATRFAADETGIGIGAGGADSGGAYGGDDSSPPSGEQGKARSQAARLVTGRDSHQVLERISRLQALAADEHQPASVRERASEELARIQDGAKVLPAHLRVNAELSLAALDQLAADPAQPAVVRERASREAASVRAAHEAEAKAAELEQLAKAALARVRAAKHTSGRSATPAAPSPAGPVLMPVSVFLRVWEDMAGWWAEYDPQVIAADLTEAQWAAFCDTVAGTTGFRDAVLACRQSLATTATTPDPGTAESDAGLDAVSAVGVRIAQPA